VIGLLQNAGYWDNPAAWRYYGDRESNYNTIGSQQSHPEAALVEKLINSVDARLINEALVRGIHPEGAAAPLTIRAAVAQFFDDSPKAPTAGLVREWLDNKRTEVARGITLAATGAMPEEGKLSLTISDCGEGQTPEMMPNTLLSLDRTNKLRIPFVQGKFNMGGTGALRFCGQHNLQLVLSRRNPAIVEENSQCPSDSEWGFTIVRRENPEGGRRSSVYTYLAPIGMESNPGKGGVLHFSSDTMPIFPDDRTPYARESKWGTLIKLYEYSLTGSKSHILRKKGLLSRIDLLMPDVALPIRLHECRTQYGGHRGSFETTLAGVGVRLEDDKTQNLEEGFPSSSPMSVAGEQMTATIYAFKNGKADTYRRSEGIIFTINGQTHGHFTTDFFRRQRLGLSYLRDSILVIVDCTKLSGRAREDLFMNSRDRLSGSELRFEIESALESILKQHPGLRALSESRRRQEIQDRLEESKPLEDILESLLKQSPTLTALFLQGKRVPNPFKTARVQAEEKPFVGKRYPSYFKFEGKEYGTVLHRDCHINFRCRVIFETDVVSDYFSRDIDRGEFSLFIISDEQLLPVKDYSLNLQNGTATLNVQLPMSCREGDELPFVARVEDKTRIEPFENRFIVKVKEPAEASPGGAPSRRNSAGNKEGNGRETAAGIELPMIIKVYENPIPGAKGWKSMHPPFDKYSALRIIHAGSSGESSGNGNGKEIYDFFINVDNIYLKTELKANSLNPEVAEARFVYGMVLLGLGLLHEEEQTNRVVIDNPENSRNQIQGQINIEEKVELFTKAVAPVLLPMIDYLGGLDLEEGAGTDSSGEAV
jgi:hypothetical protein